MRHGKVIGHPPLVCPFCAKPLEVIRHIVATHYEVACTTGCERTAIISIDDHEVLPNGERQLKEAV
jgi:hypothetical protein